MTQEEMIKKYQEKICPYCKAQCNKGITVVKDKSTIYAKCVDYEKDESKIERYKEPIQRTAKLGHMIMPKLISDWS